ncbi:MAG: hypothetical protein JEZ09_02955 [Salinivirgaceae bacterium]|nr:hypothetical protein [Salinivirgaceae bacterium]
MKRILLNIIAICFVSNVFSQALNTYEQDFKELTNIVHSSYPLNDSINNLLLKCEPDYLQKLKNCEDKDMFLIVAEQYLAKLNDGHTKIDCYQPFTRKGYHQIKFNFINDRLYISNYSNSVPDNYIGKEVIEINGIDIKTIFQKAKDYISADNDVCSNNYLSYLLRLPTFLDFLGIDTNSELELKLKDETVLIWFRDTEKKEAYVKYNDESYPIDNQNLTYYKAKENELTGWSNKLFEYKILEESNTCYFNFRECLDIQWLNTSKGAFKPFPNWLVKIFWWFRGGNFSTFCKKMFKAIDKNNIENLIIDLRPNRGGTSILGYQLLDYLTDIENLKDYNEQLVLSDLLKSNHPDYFNQVVQEEHLTVDSLPQIITSDNSNGVNDYLRAKDSPYYQAKPTKKFKGKVYVMVGDRTFSSAAMIAVLFADNNLATIVGNPMGMGASSCGEVLSFALTNTAVKGTLSCKKFTRPNNDLGKELSIDIPLTNTERNNYEGVDYEFEELLKIINNDNKIVN